MEAIIAQFIHEMKHGRFHGTNSADMTELLNSLVRCTDHNRFVLPRELLHTYERATYSEEHGDLRCAGKVRLRADVGGADRHDGRTSCVPSPFRA